MIVIVTGGRKYRGEGLVAELEKRLADGMTHIVYGCARGADRLARMWALDTDGIERHYCKADWSKLGPNAGNVRNGHMIATAIKAADGDKSKIVLIAAPGGTGTKDCIQQARAADISVFHVWT